MAALAPSKILIFGGTGTIGQYITASLLRAKPAFGSLVLFTSANTASSKTTLLDKWKADGLSVTVGDVTSDADVAAAFRGVDTVVSCVGLKVLPRQVDLLRLAEESGTVKWFLPSEYGTDVEHNPTSLTEKTHQPKLQVRKYVAESIKRVKVAYVVTGPYFDMWLNTLPGALEAGGFVLGKKEAYVIDEGEGKVGFCTMRDVGKFVVATLRHPNESFGKALKVQSFVVTPNQVLAELEKQTGAKWTVTKTPLSDIRALETKFWDGGDPKSRPLTLRRIWANGGTLYAKNDNELLGLSPADLDTLEVGVRRHLEGGDKAETI